MANERVALTVYVTDAQLRAWRGARMVPAGAIAALARALDEAAVEPGEPPRLLPPTPPAPAAAEPELPTDPAELFRLWWKLSPIGWRTSLTAEELALRERLKPLIDAFR